MAYQPLHSSPQQSAVLEQVLVRAQEPGAVVVLDLDGCLFDSRHRQIHILREFASLSGESTLWRVRPEHFQDWILPNTLRAAGVPVELAEDLQEFWFKRFFDGEYVLYDHAMPGAARFVWRLHKLGAEVVYLTGRHHKMRSGTERALKRSAFPYEIPRTQLLTKPTFEQDDARFKEQALEHIAGLGKAVVFLDNEPANVNLFHAHNPQALVVWVQSDHSPRPIQAVPSLPCIKSFLM